MRRTIVLAFSLTAAVAGVLFFSGGPGRDTAQDVAGSLGLVEDPPFQMRLSGRL